MSFTRLSATILCSFCLPLAVFALDLGVIGEQKVSSLTASFDVAAYGGGYEVIDRNGDGNGDYIIQTDRGGNKLFEAMDYNHDGFLDDFYIFGEGILIRRELDTNFDRAIDLWVHMYNGAYVQAYERDTDFDGKIDTIKEFGQKTASL